MEQYLNETELKLVSIFPMSGGKQYANSSTGGLGLE